MLYNGCVTTLLLSLLRLQRQKGSHESWRLGHLEKGCPSCTIAVGVVHRRVVSAVLQRLDTAAAVFYGLRLLSATWAFRVDYRVKLIGVSLEEGV